MRLKDVAIGVKDLFMLDPATIQEEPGWNVRVPGPDLDAHIRQLANSIKQIGVQEPVTVYLKNDVPVLTNGHCRLMAVKLAISEGADIRAIPARAEERYANDADRVLGMITRNGGKPLSSLEQAEVVRRLLAFGWTNRDIVSKTGYSDTHIANLQLLLSAPAEVTQLIASGQVSSRLAVDTVRKNGEQAVSVLKGAVATAQEKGRGRATMKHLPQQAAQTAPDANKIVVEWSVWGPRLKVAMEAIRDADSQVERMECIETGSRLLGEMVGLSQS